MNKGYLKNKNKRTDNPSDLSPSYKHDSEADIGELFISRETNQLSFKKDIGVFDRYSEGTSGDSYKDLGLSSVVDNIDWSQATTQELNLDTNPTLTFENATPGADLNLLLSAGVTQRSVTWPNNVTWSRNLIPTINKATAGGALDESFQIGTGFNYNTTFVKTLSSGKLLVSTGGSSYNGTYPIPSLIRLNANGTIDDTWTNLNWGGMSTEKVIAAVELPNGNILVGGYLENYGDLNTYGNNAIQLLDPNGARINTFAPVVEYPGGSVSVTDFAVQSSGKIIVTGRFETVNGIVGTRGIFRLNADLSVDTSFVVNLDGANFIASAALLSDDSIIIGSYFYNSQINGVGSFNGIAKLTADGAPVGTSFGNLQGGMYGLNISKIAVSSDDKIYVGGSLMIVEGMSYYQNLVKLNTDGTRDTSFDSVGANNPVNSFYIIPSGTLVVLGSSDWDSTYYGGYVVFVKPDGQLDPNIIVQNGGFNSSPRSVTIQGDKLVFVGYFTTYASITSNYIARLTMIPQTKSYTEVNFQYNGVDYIGSF